MELSGMSMCNVHLDFNDDVDFGFDDLSAGCSSASISGSSYASSSFGPQTPVSGRSTPPHSGSLDFGTASFASTADTVPFDMTPPSSDTSSYFPMALKSGNDPDLVYSTFPLTPSRGQLGFSGHSLSNCGTHLTPSQTIDYGFFVNDLGPHPLLSTPSALTQVGQSSSTCSLWLHADSPVSFEEQSPSRLVGSTQSVKLEHEEFVMDSIKRESEGDIMAPVMISAATRKRARMEEARLKTSALREVQQSSQCNARGRTKTGKQLRMLAAGSGSMPMENIQPGKFKCPYEGCKTGPYRRNEHLKRHIQSAHKGTIFICDWCGKRVNRKDNWLSHIRLHTLKRGKARVVYEPQAVAQYEQEMKRIETRHRRSPKTKKRASSGP